VGKTELARALAEFLFDDERAMIRIDMSEYRSGTPSPGSSARRRLRRLRRGRPAHRGRPPRPYSVVLFDEIEKAHAEVFNVLLQILDDGRLTDGQGRTVDFKNSVVIMTSNVGSQWIQDLGGKSPRRCAVGDGGAARAVPAGVPEPHRRADHLQLAGMDQIRRIVDIQLRHLRDRLADRKLGIEVTDAAKAKLAEEGFDPIYGARPLKRAIQREIQDPLATKVLAASSRKAIG